MHTHSHSHRSTCIGSLCNSHIDLVNSFISISIKFLGFPLCQIYHFHWKLNFMLHTQEFSIEWFQIVVCMFYIKEIASNGLTLCRTNDQLVNLSSRKKTTTNIYMHIEFTHRPTIVFRSVEIQCKTNIKLFYRLFVRLNHFSFLVYYYRFTISSKLICSNLFCSNDERDSSKIDL